MKKLVSLLLILVLATALTVPAYAAGSPSVSVPAAPVVAPTEEATVSAVDKDGNEVEVPAEDVKVEAAAKLEGDDKAAYDTLAAAEDVSAVCENAEEVLKKVDADANVADLVVRDVFKVSFDGKAKEIVEESDESYVAVTFEYDVKAGDTVIVMQYVDGKWVAMDPDMYEIEDGKIIVNLATECVVAFVTVK